MAYICKLSAGETDRVFISLRNLFIFHRLNMVRAWYMDDSDEDQRLPHMTDPLRPVSLEELKEKTGMEYLKVIVSSFPLLNVLKACLTYR